MAFQAASEAHLARMREGRDEQGVEVELATEDRSDSPMQVNIHSRQLRRADQHQAAIPIVQVIRVGTIPGKFEWEDLPRTVLSGCFREHPA